VHAVASAEYVAAWNALMRLHQSAGLAGNKPAGCARKHRFPQSARDLRRIAVNEFDAGLAAPRARDKGDAFSARVKGGEQAVENQFGAAELRELLADEDDAVGLRLDGGGGVRHGRAFSITSPIVLEEECRGFP
jgi:hypothetical protein